MWYGNNSQYNILEKKINAFEDITIKKKSSKWSKNGEKAKEWLTEHLSYGGTSIANCLSKESRYVSVGQNIYLKGKLAIFFFKFDKN